MQGLESKLLGAIYRHYPINETAVQKIFDVSGSYDRTISIIEQGLKWNVDPVMLATSIVGLKQGKGKKALQYKSRVDGKVVFEVDVTDS